jgi:hypothetical protein
VYALTIGEASTPPTGVGIRIILVGREGAVEGLVL